ncbi:MMPL family transporter [Horticoccus luteus]|uniref:MMPL family transporter n=1 Tax=Horticoccus luteus TaxID=2862869 RepID=A0A8F9TUZ8_9BACT|nr:MMPL family transporter [Horticoccus luteus]QYM79606.1 MMPL family transporter [Horticoccus luteus]
MTAPRRKLYARLVLLAFVALCGTWLARLDYSQKISTNVLDLIPAEEQSPEIALVRSFANEAQSRVMLFALHDTAQPNQPPAAAAQRFATALARSPAFAEAVVVGGSTDQSAMGREIFTHRFELLLPTFLGDAERDFAATGQPAAQYPAWLAERSAARLEAFLSRPEATALQNVVVSDPLLLVPSLIDRARLISSSDSAAGGHALVWARLRASPLAEAGQQPAFAAIHAATAELQAATPTLDVEYTGINRFAADSRARTEAELRWLNLLSIVAVLGISALFVRRIYKILHLVPIILLSLLGAWTISTLVFDRLHLLVFVIGSLLSGVAIDYGFYIFMQPSLTPDEPYGTKLRRLLKPLLASCLTTVIGFSLLLFSNLPLIQQVGIFVGSGLLCALGGAMLYFAQLDRPFLAAREFGSLDAFAHRPALRYAPTLLFGLAILIAALGPWHLHWRDDIRQLENPSADLRANEVKLRRLFGENHDQTLYLTYGATLAEARENLAAFHADLARRAPDAPAASAGLVLPTQTDWQAFPARLRHLDGFADAFSAALDRHGFDAQSFAGFFSTFSNLRAFPPRGDYQQLIPLLDPIFTGPLALLYSRGSPSWFLTIVDIPDGPPAPPGLHTVGVNQLETLNDLFTRYRWSALRLSLIGLGMVILSVFVIYPWRRGIRIALIPAGSCFFVFGIFGLLGQPLNLFHLLGAFLGVCLSHNYAIFSADAATHGTAPPASIRLSALSTAVSFGVLSLSSIPVIHALGLTVALIVVTALATVELEPLVRRR